MPSPAPVGYRRELGVEVAVLKLPVADQEAPAIALDSQSDPGRDGEVAVVRGVNLLVYSGQVEVVVRVVTARARADGAKVLALDRGQKHGIDVND